jgi:allophanate hydrolase
MKTIEIPRTLSLPWLREKYLAKELTPLEVVQEIIHRAAEDVDWHIWITPPSLEIIQPYLERLASLDPVQPQCLSA